MRQIGVVETYKKGKVIFKEGTFGEGTYVIISGTVDIVKTVDGHNVIIATLGKNDIFGEMSFFDKEPRSASAIAQTDVQVGILDKDQLEQEINRSSENFRVILKAIVERLRKTTMELVTLKNK